MSNSAAAQEPSMEEILASIRRIITDEEGNPTTEQKSQNDDDSVEKVLGTDDAETEDSILSSSQPMSPDDLDALFAPDEDNESVGAKAGATETEFASEDSEPEASSKADNADEEVLELTAAEIEDDGTEAADDEIELVDGMDIIFDEIEEELPAPEPEVSAKAEPEVSLEPAPTPVVHRSRVENLISNQAATSVSESFSNLSGLVVSSQAKTMEDLLKEMMRPMLQSWLDQNLPTMVEKMVAVEIRRLSGKD